MNNQEKIETIKINNVEYVRKDQVGETPKGNRAIVVIDRGWIYAGDVVQENGRITINNAVWVFKWESVGFSGIVADPSKADLRKMPYPVDLPEESEVYRVAVPESWGK